MKSSRRGFLAKVAALAGAAALAPAVKAEAALANDLSQAEIDALYVKAYGQERVDSWGADAANERVIDGLYALMIGNTDTQIQKLQIKSNFVPAFGGIMVRLADEESLT